MNVLRYFPIRGMRLVLGGLLALALTGPSLGQAPGPTQLLAYELGFTPETVVLAKLEEECDGLLLALKNAVAETAALQTQRQSLSDKMETVRVIGNGMHTGDERVAADYKAAMADFKATQALYLAARVDLFELAVASLSTVERGRLDTCRATASYRIPAAFKVAALEVGEWKRLERAVHAEKRALRRGGKLDESHADLLTQVRAEFDVIEATLRLQSKLADVEASFVAIDD